MQNLRCAYMELAITDLIQAIFSPISKHLIGGCYVLFLFVDIEAGYV